MSKARRTLLLTIGVAIILLMGLGTYSFFAANITGNIAEDIVVQETGTLKIEYVEVQNINANAITPGWEGTKTLQVKNNRTLSVEYDLLFIQLINTFATKEDLVYSISCTSNQVTCPTKGETQVPDTGPKKL